MFKEVRKDKLGEKVLEHMSREVSVAVQMIEGLTKGLSIVPDESLRKNSLLLTCISLFQNQLEGKRQELYQDNWVNSGLTEFSKILGHEFSSEEEYYGSLLSKVVGHVQACQGALFVMNEETHCLELKASYARESDRLDIEIQKGEGLIGQCFLRAETLLLHRVPNDYTHISSGLGKSNPTFLLIMPIKNESGVAGVLELSCFSSIGKHKLMFLEKLSEQISTVIQRETSKKKIQNLLQESKITQDQILNREKEIQSAFDKLRLEHARQIDEIERNAIELKKQKEQLLQALSVDNILIDVAGRNRMLSQKICFLSEMIVAGKRQYVDQLQKTIQLHDDSLACIKNGGAPPEVSSQLPFAAAGAFLLPFIQAVEAVWQPFREHALFLLDPEITEESKRVCIGYIEEHGLELLKLNNDLVVRCIEFNRNKLMNSGLMKS